MEADWEFEIGPGAPVIDAHWAGLVDLHAHPELAAELSEARDFTPLVEALIELNSQRSPFRTSKCDRWTVDLDEANLDADELNADAEMLAAATACYIDLLLCQPQEWHSPDRAAEVCTALCTVLRKVPVRGCRADLVVRRAILSGNEETLGITAYLTACGPSPAEADQALARALRAFADSAATGSSAQSTSQIQ